MSITIDSAPFIKAVKKELARKSWTQAQLSEKTGFSRSQISRLLAGKGKRVQQSTVDKILRALNIEQEKLLATAVNKNTPTIYSDRLPTVTGQFIGRSAELELIDQAQRDNTINILQLIAPGGTGKTKLLRQWLNATHDKKQSVIAWSFYSQGASADKQISASPFFQHAFELLNVAPRDFSSDEDKGDYLASQLRTQQCLLILDGLEPLQYADPANRGELKDRALSRLLRNIAGQPGVFCIVSSRIAVYELSDRASVLSHNLQNLALPDGIALLQLLGVHGSEEAIKQAVVDYDGHALALSLLGNLLRLRYQGDIGQRSNLPALIQKNADKTSRHAFKVMQAYEDWFSGTPELRLLYLLGLFDHPVDVAVMEALWKEGIPNLTDNIQEVEWYQAIDSLRHEHHLLTDVGHTVQQANTRQTLDCHPLIREYFGKQLKDLQPVAWQKAHECLFEYYQALPEKELPDTLEEMRPLFEAVKHGCLAERYEEAFEVYWKRICHTSERYLTLKLGAYSDDLAVISHFYSIPWDGIKGNLDPIFQTFLNLTAFTDLSALGRINEAYKPSKKFLKHLVDQENWPQAVELSEHISQQQLTLGNLQEAINTAKLGMDYADYSETPLEKIKLRVLLAHALNQSGSSEESKELLLQAAIIHTKVDGSLPPQLYLIPSYCELLIEQGQLDSLLGELSHLKKWNKDNTFDTSTALPVALIITTLAQASMSIPNLLQAVFYTEVAVKLLRQSNRKDMLPITLLTRAAGYRETNDFSKAYQDLQEVYDIAEPSGMRLYLTDYHLEMARLLLKQWQQQLIDDTAQAEIQTHVTSAVKLIEETGYHRRDAEVEVLIGPMQTTSKQQKKWSEEW